MKRYVLLIIFALTILPLITEAQTWKRNPSSIVYGNGTNHFLGDLGGGKKEAAHFFGLRDLDYQVTRPTWQIGYRYRFHDFFTFRVNYTYALISGKDAASGSLDRQARNLSFRSGVYELSTQIEYYFVKEKGAAKSSFGSLKGFTPLSAYVFIGGGALYYNPKARLDDNSPWVALQPLGTEGQFANPDGSPYTYTYSNTGESLTTPEPYKRIAAMISLGIGMKYDLNKQWALGFELSNRYTSSDYMDDVHDRYFNYEQMGLTPPNSNTLLFSDRSYELIYSDGAITGISDIHVPKTTGQAMRGDPNFNDAYVLALITVYYKLGGSSKAKPKYR
ncbi:MAG: hypothetical protein JXL97_08250 [Bacteroidales bacterium]|nr:hypothetical protein [Bacteroidales bacterium]